MTAPFPGPANLSAPAKLTLSLRITGTRGDGFHLLESEMVTVDLMDTLRVEEGDGLTMAIESSAAGWPPTPISVGPDNLVARALAAAGRTAQVHVVKRIPPGAGLGGGSADAAAILRWAGCAEGDLAVGLGADVPFCLVGGRALVRGVGQEVEALPHIDRRFTLLLVPFGVETGAVYRAWDERGSRGEGLRPASTATTWKRRRWLSSRAWRPGGPASRRSPEGRRSWPGAARPGSWRDGPRRWDWVTAG